jgi:hypothetical protein
MPNYIDLRPVKEHTEKEFKQVFPLPGFSPKEEDTLNQTALKSSAFPIRLVTCPTPRYIINLGSHIGSFLRNQEAHQRCDL